MRVRLAASIARTFSLAVPSFDTVQALFVEVAIDLPAFFVRRPTCLVEAPNSLLRLLLSPLFFSFSAGHRWYGAYVHGGW